MKKKLFIPVLMICILLVSCTTTNSQTRYSSSIDIENYNPDNQLSSILYGSGKYSLSDVENDYEAATSSLSAFYYCIYDGFKPDIHSDSYSIAILSEPYYGQTSLGSDYFFLLVNPRDSSDYVVCKFTDSDRNPIIPSCTGGYVLYCFHNAALEIIDTEGHSIFGIVYSPSQVSLNGKCSTPTIANLVGSNQRAGQLLILKEALEFVERLNFEKVRIIYTYSDGFDEYAVLSDGRRIDFISHVLLGDNEFNRPLPGFAYLTKNQFEGNEINHLASSNSYNQISKFEPAEYYTDSLNKTAHEKDYSDMIKNAGYLYADYICMKYDEDAKAVVFVSQSYTTGNTSPIEYMVYNYDYKNPKFYIGLTMWNGDYEYDPVFKTVSLPGTISNFDKLEKITISDYLGQSIIIDKSRYSFSAIFTENSFPTEILFFDVTDLIDVLSKVIGNSIGDTNYASIMSVDYSDDTLDFEYSLASIDTYDFPSFLKAFSIQDGNNQ